MTINEIPQPSSLQEVEQLIQALYNPRSSPDDVRNINRVLQGLQTSQNGWILSHQLSASSNEHTQFFAALSFIVKLNTDWTSLSSDDTQQLLQTLIDWLIRAIRTKVKSYIWRKLCLTLVTFYIHFSQIWPLCIRHLLCSITNHAAVPVGAIGGFPKTEAILAAACPEEQEVVLYFTKSLVEEVMKLDAKVLQNQHFEQSLEDNVSDTVILIASILNAGIDLGQNSDIQYEFEPDEKHQAVLEESLSCYQAWASYSARTNLASGSKFLEFRRLSIMIMRWIKNPKLFIWATTVITEVLTSSPKFFSEDDVIHLASLITSDWGQKKLSQTVGLKDDNYDPAENSVFPQLAIAFAEANVDHIAKAPTNHTSAIIFSMLHSLLKLPGSPVADEDISSLEFEFWSSLIELLTEQSTGPDHSSWWMQTCKQHVFQAIEEFWSKIHIPLPSVLVEWTKDDKEGFQSFRKDVADLLETAYPLLHYELFEKLVSHVLMQVDTDEPNWRDVEASLFCINSISDSMTSDPQEYQSLSMLLSSPLFTKLAAPETNPFLRTRLAGIALIGQYSSFFERNPQFLAPALNFLFSSLTIPQLVSQASRSIFLLCSSCRKELVPELFTFIGQYEVFASTHNHDTSARERVIGAIGCIVQVLPAEELKLKALEPVLTTIFRDLNSCKVLISMNQAEEAKLAAVSVLKCLVSLGKALQAPDDLPIILDDDNVSTETFWSTGKGLEMQTAIAKAVKDLAITLNREIEVVDTACCVFRSGFSETSPGLLVFQAAVIADFLLSLIGRCPFHDIVFGTASSFVCSHSSSGSQKIEHEASELKRCILQASENARNEPDVAQNILEFFNRLIPKYLSVLFDTPVDFIFTLALDSLMSKELFTKKAAATFWCNIINAIFQDDKHRRQIQDSISIVGQRLARNLIAGIGGDAARSELDCLTDVLKKLVFRIPVSKNWLESALFTTDDFPSAKISRAEKQMFVKQLFMLRGGRGTYQLVKEFWMKCRGISFDYVS